MATARIAGETSRARLGTRVVSAQQPHELAETPSELPNFMEMFDLAFGAEPFRREGRHPRVPEPRISPVRVLASIDRDGHRPAGSDARVLAGAGGRSAPATMDADAWMPCY